MSTLLPEHTMPAAGPPAARTALWSGLPAAAAVEPLACGVLYFVHLGKTGGTEVTKHLSKLGPAAGWSYHVPQGSFDPDEPSETWARVLADAKQEKPKLIVHHHHHAPGVSTVLESALRPLACQMRAKGCGWTLATVLRNPRAQKLSAARIWHV